VRLCATGEPVLVHDPALPDGRPVHKVARSDLPESVVTLADAIDLADGRLVNVELKPDVPRRVALARAAAAVVARARRAEVVFSSFDPFLVLATHALAPRSQRGILVGPRTPRLAVAMPLAMRTSIHAAHLHDDLVTRDRVRRLVSAGLRVLVWTVNDTARARDLALWGVEQIITDRPALIVAARS
jgi:glycerophosphoryl diester phosphodiesterase